jgi:dTDP-4-dehydrorhamnose reductase
VSSIVIIGRRNRLIEPSIRQAAIVVGCEWTLENPSDAAAILSTASSVVFLGYVRKTNGEVDSIRSANLASLVKQACGSNMSRLLYLSTDGVFRGTEGGYTTAHAPEPKTAYGAMKLKQETMLQGACILRFTVFGPSFSERPMLSDMVFQRAPMTVFPNSFFSPVSTFKVNDVLREHFQGRVPPGIHHLAGDRISKAKLVSDLVRAQGLIEPLETAIDCAPTSDFSLVPSATWLATSLEEELARLARWRNQ